MSNKLKRKLKDSGIPYQVAGGDSFWTSKQVKLVIEILTFLLKVNDSAGAEEDQDKAISFLNSLEDDFLERLEGSDLLEEFTKIQKKPGSLTDWVSVIAEKFISISSVRIGAQAISNSSRTGDSNLEELFSVLGAFEEKEQSLAERIKNFLNYYEKIAENDFYDAQSDKVTLLTMHAAKGLEFKYVFVLGFCDRLVPFVKKSREKIDSKKKIDRKGETVLKESCLKDLNAVFLDQNEAEELQEERRLFFVALTRAGQGLYLLYTKERFGKKDWGESRFKAEISGANWQELEDPALVKVERRREIKRIKDSQTSLF